jgi:hypothetical protein
VSAATISDGDALDQIAALIHAETEGDFGGPYLPQAIAEIVRGTGRDVGQINKPGAL